MVVEAHIRRSDLIAMNFALLLRLRINLIFLFILFVVVSVSARSIATESVPLYVGVVFVGFVLVAAVLFIGGFLLQALFATERQGFLGPHRFEIASDGFYEETKGTRTSTQWSAISKLIVVKRHIYVLISAYRVHIIPKRAFESEAEFRAFARQLQDHLRLESAAAERRR